MGLNKSSYIIPSAIVISGLIIAVAIFINQGGDKIKLLESNKSSAVTEKTDAFSQTQQQEFTNKTAKIDEDDDPVLGDPLASVIFINFGDFRCQFCAKFQKEIKPAIVEKYVKTGKIKYVYRDLITMGENSILAAGGANCAGEQDRYWDFADYLHSGEAGHSVVYTIDSLSEIASSLGLDIPLFKECLSSERHKEEIKKDTEDAKASGATGTPTVFINGRLIVGLNPLEEYERIIEEELLKAETL